ncbi:hypothetical protein GX50_00987 [[Emmonsia] crescens]|uniref:Uncharacterized protein n=1 Tax=[Emmonsia] crescens TaxID=73230 RepID=A0A2B7ZSZ6_9EURO|nr:hypothetical protein GX50_00987 [Emmonsia crescens]
MSDSSPEQVRGTSQISWSDWDELPDRLDIEFPPDKFNLPGTTSPNTRHDEQHLETGGCRNSRLAEGVQFLSNESPVMGGHHVNKFISFPFTTAYTSMAHAQVNRGTATETRALDGNPFGKPFAFQPGSSNVHTNLIDPQILGISTGSPQPRRARVPRFNNNNNNNNAPHNNTMSTARDEIIPATSSFSSTTSYESTSSSIFFNATSSSYPTPSSNTTHTFQSAPGQNNRQPGNTLLPPAELDVASQQPLHQLSQIVKSHIPAQTERFLSSIELLSIQTRGSMLLLRRQHALAFTIYCNCLGMEQSIRTRLWDEYLNNMRFHCINIRDGLIVSLKAICWSFAEWMGIYKNDLPCVVVLRASGALKQANELKAAIDHFVYPTWEDMVAKWVAKEQPVNISGLTLSQLVGDLAGGGVIHNR